MYITVPPGVLPDSIPLIAMGTWSWKRQFCFYDQDMRIGSGRTISGVRSYFAKSANAWLKRFLTFKPLTDNIWAELFLYHMQVEIDNDSNIDGFTTEMLKRWRGQLMVSDETMLSTKPSVKVQFRYFRKDSAYRRVQVNYEPRFRSTYGLAIPYQ